MYASRLGKRLKPFPVKLTGGTEGKSAVQVLLKLTQTSGGTCCPACQVVPCCKWLNNVFIARLSTDPWLRGMTCDSGSNPSFPILSVAVAGNTGGRQQEADQAGTDDKVNPFQIKKKAKKAAQPICRPIIAVCNDMYAPALRPLRGVAKMVQFKKPSVSFALSVVCLFWFSLFIL